jgi:hypothetical protein
VSSIKWGVTAGIAASIISTALGVFFGVGASYILIRAVIFLIVFFALGTGLRVLINNYLPELMYFDNDSSPKISFEPPPPGSQINITLGGIGEYAVPEMYRDSKDSGELGNIEDLISGVFTVRSSFESNEIDADRAYTPEPPSRGIDLRMEDDYNTQDGGFSAGPQEFMNFSAPEPPKPSKPVKFEKPVFTPVFGSDSDDLGALPDLGSMATAFSTGFDAEEATAMPHLGGEEAEPAQMQYNKGNKPQPLKGDFNPKELAEGLRTVLSKD